MPLVRARRGSAGDARRQLARRRGVQEVEQIARRERPTISHALERRRRGDRLLDLLSVARDGGRAALLLRLLRRARLRPLHERLERGLGVNVPLMLIERADHERCAMPLVAADEKTEVLPHVFELGSGELVLQLERQRHAALRVGCVCNDATQLGASRRGR